jgi:threonine/homoserine/homoserine lactone efflux protein
MILWSAIAVSLATLLLGAMSPGPSFLVVARNAIRISRGAGLSAALGMGVGGLTFCSVALLGLSAVLAKADFLYVCLKVAGGVYLVCLGYQMWRGSGTPLTVEVVERGSQSGSFQFFWTRFLTQLSNPNVVVFYASVFAALLPQNSPTWCYVVLPPAVFAIEAGWYCIVAVVLSGVSARRFYAEAKQLIARIAGTAIVLLGVRLILTARGLWLRARNIAIAS